VTISDVLVDVGRIAALSTAAATQLEHGPCVRVPEELREERGFVGVVFGRRDQLPPAGQLGVQFR
jgi:hypothetical protein